MHRCRSGAAGRAVCTAADDLRGAGERGVPRPVPGPNSLSPDPGPGDLRCDAYLGARLWSGAEAWLNPEIDQGFGLDDTLGVAGFPSGEAYKVGRKHPYLRLPRAFMRQTLDLGR